MVFPKHIQYLLYMKQIATRICPECKKPIVYKTVGHRNDAEKHK